MGKLCKRCQKLIPDGYHGNLSYCPSGCYYYAKLERQEKKYAEGVSLLEKRKQSEAILARYFKIYGSETYIAAELLDNEQFDFYFKEGGLKIEGFPTAVIGTYAFCLFNNRTIRIWKLP